MSVLSQIVDEAHYIDTHIEFRNLLQSCKTSAQQVVRRLAMADKTLEIRGCQLDQSPKKIPLLSLVSRCMPEPLEHFVAFPPVGIVVEIDTIKILVCPSPLFGEEQDWLRLGLPIRMSSWVATRMR